MGKLALQALGVSFPFSNFNGDILGLPQLAVLKWHTHVPQNGSTRRGCSCPCHQWTASRVGGFSSHTLCPFSALSHSFALLPLWRLLCVPSWELVGCRCNPSVVWREMAHVSRQPVCRPQCSWALNVYSSTSRSIFRFPAELSNSDCVLGRISMRNC